MTSLIQRINRPYLSMMWALFLRISQGSNPTLAVTMIMYVSVCH